MCRKEVQGEGGGTIGTDSEAEIEVVAEGPWLIHSFSYPNRDSERKWQHHTQLSAQRTPPTHTRAPCAARRSLRRARAWHRRGARPARLCAQCHGLEPVSPPSKHPSRGTPAQQHGSGRRRQGPLIPSDGGQP